MESTKTKGKRKYHRRTDEQRIADLQRRITELKARQAQRDRKDDPVLREIPKMRARIRKFYQLAIENNRPDISNTVWAWETQLERFLESEKAPTRRRSEAEFDA